MNLFPKCHRKMFCLYFLADKVHLFIKENAKMLKSSLVIKTCRHNIISESLWKRRKLIKQMILAFSCKYHVTRNIFKLKIQNND